MRNFIQNATNENAIPGDPSSRAMLVSLSIRVMGEGRKDQRMSREAADREKASRDRINAVKKLFNKSALKPIRDIRNEARYLHYSLTLPWSDEGQRILPVKKYEQYKADIESKKLRFRQAVKKFVGDYDKLMEENKRELGNAFNPADYPSKEELPHFFGFDWKVMTMPRGSDFRAAIGQAEADRIAKRIESEMLEEFKKADAEIASRLHKAVAHMAKKLQEYKPADGDEKAAGIFRDSMVNNLKELTEVLPEFLFTEHPEVTRLINDAARLTKHDADTLRLNPEKREETQKAAEALAEDISNEIDKLTDTDFLSL